MVALAARPAAHAVRVWVWVCTVQVLCRRLIRFEYVRPVLEQRSMRRLSISGAPQLGVTDTETQSAPQLSTSTAPVREAVSPTPADAAASSTSESPSRRALRRSNTKPPLVVDKATLRLWAAAFRADDTLYELAQLPPVAEHAPHMLRAAHRRSKAVFERERRMLRRSQSERAVRAAPARALCPAAHTLRAGAPAGAVVAGTGWACSLCAVAPQPPAPRRRVCDCAPMVRARGPVPHCRFLCALGGGEPTHAPGSGSRAPAHHRCASAAATHRAPSAIRRPQSTAHSTTLWAVDAAITTLFVLECLIKCVAMGVVFTRNAYLHDGWNVLDFVAVVSSVVNLALPNVDLGFVRVVRALRILRPLRLISRSEGLRTVVDSLLRALPGVANVLLVLSFIFLVFGILGAWLQRPRPSLRSSLRCVARACVGCRDEHLSRPAVLLPCAWAAALAALAAAVAARSRKLPRAPPTTSTP